MKKLIFLATLVLAGCSDASVSTQTEVGPLPQGEPKIEISKRVSTGNGHFTYTIYDKARGTVCTVVDNDSSLFGTDPRPSVSCVFIGDYPDATSWEEFGDAKEN